MIDLHLHTNHSDGSDSVLELLSKAQKLNVEILSITDHDSIGAYLELERIKHNYQGKIIRGTELKTIYKGIPIEILGYNIDINIMKDSPCVSPDNHLNIQNQYLENYKKVAKDLGLSFTHDLVLTEPHTYAAINFYYDLVKYPENYEIFPPLKDILPESFYRLTSSNPDSPFYIDEQKDVPNINFVIDEIHKANGLAFIAHPCLYKVDNHREFIQSIFDNTKVDGCECYHTGYTKEQIALCLDISKQNNKLISGGSDYHGLNKENYYIGIVQNEPIPQNEMLWL